MSDAGAAGWFGKIPALGDFTGRRLPPEFVEPWDQWLSTELSDARQLLGPDWPPSHLDAPIWRFVLTPGVLDSRYWFGILLPSADRVGRRFPLSLAASGEQAFARLHAWWAGLASAALKSREPDCDAEALDQAVLAAGRPIESAGAAPEPGAIGIALAAAGPGATVWSSFSSDERDPDAAWVVGGLPRGEHFQRLWRPPRRS